MFNSDKIVGKIKQSKKPFEVKKKAPWDKFTSENKIQQKKFPRK